MKIKEFVQENGFDDFGKIDYHSEKKISESKEFVEDLTKPDRRTCNINHVHKSVEIISETLIDLKSQNWSKAVLALRNFVKKVDDIKNC